MVTAEGQVLDTDGAPFHGDAQEIALVAPAVGIATTPSGGGYWLAAADGGVFAFGDAPFAGSLGGDPPDEPVIGMAATPSGKGYWLVDVKHNVYAFGDATPVRDQHVTTTAAAVAVLYEPGGYLGVVAADGLLYSY